MLLDEFIASNRDEIIERCRVKVGTRPRPLSIEPESKHGVPLFLDQLVDALHLGAVLNEDIGQTALRHGHDLLVRGFTISQVVHTW